MFERAHFCPHQLVECDFNLDAVIALKDRDGRNYGVPTIRSLGASVLRNRRRRGQVEQQNQNRQSYIVGLRYSERQNER
jgi:hypothetical protein